MSSIDVSSSSFTTTKINGSTFLIVEDDEHKEHPYIYARVKREVLVLSDTGCDAPSKERKNDRFVHLREYLEQCPLPCNEGAPLNPGGKRTYVVICTHCHFDHTGGIMQFLRGGTTEIIAPAAGRDFIESDLGKNGIFDRVGRPVPYYQVTHYAQSFERLKWPLKRPAKGASKSRKQKDLGITIISTPGHTPDELAWYDHGEKHLYVGDSFYEEGSDRMPILLPPQGNLVEWVFSMMKLQAFIKSENAHADEQESCDDKDGWISVPKRVKVGCGHQTAGADGEELMAKLLDLWWRVLRGEVPLVGTRKLLGMVLDTWAEPDRRSKMYFEAPRHLMEQARSFFKGSGMC